MLPGIVSETLTLTPKHHCERYSEIRCVQALSRPRIRTEDPDPLLLQPGETAPEIGHSDDRSQFSRSASHFSDSCIDAD